MDPPPVQGAMAQPNDEHLAAILAQLQERFDGVPGGSHKDRLQARRNRELVYYYHNGLSERAIAGIEGIDQSNVHRDLVWWRRRIAKHLQKPDDLIGDLEMRFDAIYQGALQDVALLDQKAPGAWRDRARLRTVALAAAVAMTRLREGTGRIGSLIPPADTDPHKRSAATDIRRLADEVRKLTGQTALDDPATFDLTAPGERAYLEGETLPGEPDTDDEADGPDR